MEEYNRKNESIDSGSELTLQTFLYAADAITLLFASPIVATRIIAESMIRMSMSEDE